MIDFGSDYREGAHPKILEKILATNMEQTPGYGTDRYCEAAREKIRAACKAPNADVHFLVGGTQSNTTVIAGVLRPYQGVISSTEGHIAVHETGAIEATGHKVITLPHSDAKITAAQVREVVEAHRAADNREHMVEPAMVYISFPTEFGTLYTKSELEDLSKTCRELAIPLFIDGARLGYGLTSPECDLTLPDIARLCDVFYIGGTKCGALFGEAIVITNDALKKDFRCMIKRQGGMLAKGRLLGIQFDVLFTDGLYFDICKNAVGLAHQIHDAFTSHGIEMHGTSTTNQQFAVLADAQIARLSERFAFELWGEASGGRKIMRFCTSWATTQGYVDELKAAIASL